MASPIDLGSLNRLLNTIERNKSGLKNSLEKISSGRRLNRAGEAPAASAISAQLRSDIRALTQSVRNVDSGNNFINTAEGGLASVTDLLARGRELASQAANGTLGDTERETLNREFTQIKAEIDRITQSAEFNGQKLLDGSLAPNSDPRIDIQAGIEAGPGNRISLNVIDAVSTESLGIAQSDISTVAGALQAMEDFERAADSVIASRGQVGAVANRLVTTANELGTRIENLTASESILADTDLAEEISNLRKSITQFQISLRTLAAHNRNNEQSVGRILDTLG
ncbi:MAG: flagellin [Nitrospinaceae bacterium]